MNNNKNNNKGKIKSGPRPSNDQLGENAYEPYAEGYDNKGNNGRGKAQK